LQFMKKSFLILVIFLFLGVLVFWKLTKKESVVVGNFRECAEAGSPIMESYPRRCNYGEETFTENIGNELENTDLIYLNTPRPNQVIKSPFIILGEARGGWYFEGNFPVVLTDWNGLIIAEGLAFAKGEWMTTEFVPFEAELAFKTPIYKNNGSLILKKSNPSGLPENDDALEIPVTFAQNGESWTACSGEAKLCPDGSAVGRAGPNCEFAFCPNTGGENILPFDSGVYGTVLLGPICPVIKDPSDPACEDKPYATIVRAIRLGSPKSSPFATVESDKEGGYKLSLPPGEYGIQPVGGIPFPACETKNVVIEPNLMSEVNLSCDTGIR